MNLNGGKVFADELRMRHGDEAFMAAIDKLKDDPVFLAKLDRLLLKRNTPSVGSLLIRERRFTEVV